MQHPTEPLAARDAPTGWRCRQQRQDQATVEPLVIPFVVVVRDELADGATPRALADQDQALEAGVLDGAHEALRVGVQGRRAGGVLDGGDIGRGERVAPGRPEERVAVMDEAPSLSREAWNRPTPAPPRGHRVAPASLSRRIWSGSRRSAIVCRSSMIAGGLAHEAEDVVTEVGTRPREHGLLMAGSGCGSHVHVIVAAIGYRM